MAQTFLLDCTLRDGGYLNDWEFGEDTIKNFGKKIAQTGVEFYEVGFIKGEISDRNRTVFPDIQSITPMITPKEKSLTYVGMLDMSKPVPIEKIAPCDGTSVDGLRVIFKQSKINEAYDYCKKIKELGYILFVQFVGTDTYSDTEFIEAVIKFNNIHPYAMSIVDSFGMIKKQQFMRLAMLADHNMEKGIVLGYHAHNNLQQAYGNAEALVEMNLDRPVCIDASVFGMGRGAGNLNLELFAQFMNEYSGKNYRIEPMLEIMDQYLNGIYRSRFWGYSLPLYMSAMNGCHPNYAIYLAKKNTLTEKSFNELLRTIPDPEKHNFSKENAEKFYSEYQKNFTDDSQDIRKLEGELSDKTILILAPGSSIAQQETDIKSFIDRKKPVIISVNFLTDIFKSDYVFSCNMRRYRNLQDQQKARRIITSNIRDTDRYDYKLNFASFASDIPEIMDNSAVVLLNFLNSIGIKEVHIAGMDGYKSRDLKNNYFDASFEYGFPDMEARNEGIKKALALISRSMNIDFLTQSQYNQNEISG